MRSVKWLAIALAVGGCVAVQPPKVAARKLPTVKRTPAAVALLAAPVPTPYEAQFADLQRTLRQQAEERERTRPERERLVKLEKERLHAITKKVADAYMSCLDRQIIFLALRSAETADLVAIAVHSACSGESAQLSAAVISEYGESGDQIVSAVEKRLRDRSISIVVSARANFPKAPVDEPPRASPATPDQRRERARVAPGADI